MSGVFKISEAGAIALHAAGFLAANPGRACRAAEIATSFGLSVAHLEKVMQRLAHAGLVTATRGPKGGFQLARPAREVTLKEVFETIEGRLNGSQCLLRTQACDGTACLLGGIVSRFNRETADYLSKTTLSDVIGVFDKKENKKARRK